MHVELQMRFVSYSEGHKFKQIITEFWSVSHKIKTILSFDLLAFWVNDSFIVVTGNHKPQNDTKAINRGQR